MLDTEIGKQYLRDIATRHEGIIMDDNILSGMPTIRGKRVDVALVLACLIADMTISDIAQDYGVEEHQIKNALTYAMDVLDHPF